jgi:hypothetical protein
MVVEVSPEGLVRLPATLRTPSATPRLGPVAAGASRASSPRPVDGNLPDPAAAAVRSTHHDCGGPTQQDAGPIDPSATARWDPSTRPSGPRTEACDGAAVPG